LLEEFILDISLVAELDILQGNCLFYYLVHP